MAFIKVKSISGSEVQFDRFLPADGIAVYEGEVMIPSGDGRVTAPLATSIPEFVAIQSMDALSPQVNKCTFIRIESGDEYEVKTSLTVPLTAIGNKVTLTTDGLNITLTTTAGVFLISSTDAKTSASTVRGFFKR